MLLTRPYARRLSALSLCLAAAVLAGCGSKTQSAPPNLTVGGAAAAATLGSSYSASVGVSGGTAPYSCQPGSGSTLPPGLVLSSACTVSGTPTAAGSYSFSVYATDTSQPQRAGSGAVSLTVNPAPLVFTSTSLATAVVSLSYSATLPIAGGVAPYTCQLTSGTMPAGLTLGSNCQITGTPTATGTASLAIKATDAESTPQTASGTLSLQVVSSGAVVHVMAGTQAVVGASVQIYAAGTTGNGSSPTALLSAPATTDANGAFIVNPLKYTCPQSTSLVYMVASGGHAGSGPTNNGTVLMSSPGACSNLTSDSSLVINEATTVASAYAFSQFLAPGAQIGSASTNTSGLGLAVGTLNNLVDVKAGTMPGPNFPATGTAPTAKLNILARVLNSCITGTSSSCTTLYNVATPSGTANAPTNTLDALLNLVRNAGLDTGTLFTLASSVSGTAYNTLPASQPSDWTLYVPFTGGALNNPAGVSIDSQGRIWVTNYYNCDGQVNCSGFASLFTNTGTPVFANGVGDSSVRNGFGGAVDANDNFWMLNEEGGPTGLGTITVFNSQGKLSLGSPFTQGGLNFPSSIAFDTDGTAWITDFGNSHMTLLDKSGSPLSGTSGYTYKDLAFPASVALDSKHTGWIANPSSNVATHMTRDGQTFTSYVVGQGPSAAAVDMNDNIWMTDYYDDSIGMVSSSGTVLTGTDGIAGGGLAHPQGIAIDGANRAWVANYRGPSITEFSAISGSTAGKIISPSAGWAPDAKLLEAYGIAIDAAGNVWVSSFGNNTLMEFVGLATPVKTPHIGPVAIP